MQMTMAVKTRKNRKFNWEPVQRGMDQGLSNRELAERFSIPIDRIRSRRREYRRNHAESVLLHANDAEGEAGLSAPLPRKPAVIAQKMEISAPSPAELTEDQLITLLSDSQAVLSLSASDAEKLMAKALQLKVARGLAIMRDPESPKEFGPMAKLFREMSGLTGDKGKGGSGLLSPQRSYGRRMVEIEARVVEEIGDREPAGLSEIEEPEGGWPEGM
jgi:hypothetical protein